MEKKKSKFKKIKKVLKSHRFWATLMMGLAIFAMLATSIIPFI